MNTNNFAVIMAGGVGSRFWPYSRNNHPKQFLDVLGTGDSLLQLTYKRFLTLCPKENIYIVTNELYNDLVKEQLPEMTEDQILLEPVRRNTAPCIAYAAYKIGKKNPNAVMVVAPSDHAIFNEKAFDACVENAMSAASEDDKLITIGITPNRPETGYGYIQYIEDEGEVKKVKTFTEKPQKEMAKKFLESGDFVWNAGIFIWSVAAIKKAFESHLDDMAETFEEISSSFYTDKEAGTVKKAYAECKNISIDYGIMEKAENVYVVFGDFGWSDLGSWNSLHEISDKDDNENVIEGQAITYDSKECMIKGPDDKLIVVQGLSGYLVAECGNVLLICEKDNESKFREFVADVKAKKGEKYL